MSFMVLAGIFASTAFLGSMILNEYLTWTDGAKEIEFKWQFVAHATEKLRQIVDQTSADCSKQVEQ
jgi:hypothetical protein